MTRLRRIARSIGNKLIELPAKGVFTIKPDKYKVRFVACGNKTVETYGKVATTDLDPGMMRYLSSWAASSPSNSISTLDVTAAFLNAPLPTGRIVILKPPSILYKLQLIPPGHVWLIYKAIYGLRESPLLWSEEHTQVITRMTFTSEGETYSVLLSEEVHKSLCLIVKRSSILTDRSTDFTGLTSKVLPSDVVAMSGISVDDFLNVGPRHVVSAYVTALRKLWKTSDPQFLSIDAELNFLGVSIRQLATGLLLHQHHYTEELLSEHASIHITARKRTTTGEPEHFNKQAPLPPDHNNIDHLEWIKIGERVLGAMLWLSTRTQPDLAYAVSAAAQVLTRDIESLKVRLRHLKIHQHN